MRRLVGFLLGLMTVLVILMGCQQPTSVGDLTGETISSTDHRSTTVVFSADSVYLLVKDGGLMDEGRYATDGDVVTFVGDTAMSFACPGLTGKYELVIDSDGAMRFRQVLDQCPDRGRTLTSLEFRLNRRWPFQS